MIHFFSAIGDVENHKMWKKGTKTALPPTNLDRGGERDGEKLYISWFGDSETNSAKYALLFYRFVIAK